MFETPILFLVFNRPDTTKRVFETIRKIRPRSLYVAADGPRCNKTGEADRCEQTRRIVAEAIDWECKVSLLYQQHNLGCRSAVALAISWFLEQEEYGIILEDDCLPDLSFFTFCESLLHHYSHDARIMMISGNNFQSSRIENEYSYYFSKYPHIWGWATWRRAWQHYDTEMKGWPSLKSSGSLRWMCGNVVELDYWTRIFDSVYEGKIDTWDYQWTYSCWSQNGLSICPAVNLVSNVGFGNSSTHTKDPDSPLANLPVGQIENVIHPSMVVPNYEADLATFNTVFRPKGEKIGRDTTCAVGVAKRIVKKLRQILK